jgi:cyclase
MVINRIIPCLLMSDAALVKTIRFKNPNYIGDPCNTIRIFNELEVDEIALLDIDKTLKKCEPDYSLLKDIAQEAFMPMSYGGGIKTEKQAQKIFEIGFEKIIINSLIYESPGIVRALSSVFGSQAIVASVDYKKSFFKNQNYVYIYSGRKNTFVDVNDYCKKIQDLGVGEIILTSIEKEGTWNNFDYKTIKKISSSLTIPIIAHGGCGKVEHIINMFNQGNSVAVGSLVVYLKKDGGVLVNIPNLGKL